MIGLNQLMIGLVAGAVLIVFGLVPGLFQALVEGVRHSVNLWSSGFPGPFRAHEQSLQPTWLAGLGTALIAVTVLAYLST